MRSLVKERSEYEDLYDHTTVFLARIDMKTFLDLRDEWLKIMPDNEENKYRNPWHLNHLYMIIVGNKLVDRYDEREPAIANMMAEDEARDAKLSSVRLPQEPVCEHCHKTSLRIIDKEFMHRDGHEDDGILFILRCSACEKNTAIWEDGTPWERRHTKCPKCESAMEEKSSRRGKIITTT